MATSAVPAAITALIEILRAAPGLAGVQVCDGPPVEDQSQQDLLAIGWRPDDPVSVEMTQEFAYAGARTRNEDFGIRCWLDTWSGDADITTARARAFALLAEVENAIRASGSNPTAPTVGGSVQWGHLTNAQLRQGFSEDGIEAGIAFTITCRARI